MSTQGVQQDLSEAFQQVEAQREERALEMREQALEGGARYRSPPTTTRDEAGDDLATTKRECQNCGEKVTERYWLGNSDNDNVLHHCKWCPSVNQTDMKNGAGAKPNYQHRIEDHHTRTTGGGQ